MPIISVTFCVSKFDTSSVSRAEQPENIPPMLVTFFVSKFDRSSVVRAEQP